MHKCTRDFISDIGVHADQDIAFDTIQSTKKFSLDIIALCAYGLEVSRPCKGTYTYEVWGEWGVPKKQMK